MDLTFSGAGFMGCYYFGVVDCWQKYIPRDRVNRVAGASAGSLIAAYYLMDLQLSTCLREIIEMTEAIRSRSLGVFDRNHQMVDMLPRLLDRLFPDDAHKQVSGRLHVCMTRLKDMKRVLVNEFESKKDLIDALNCSCFIPVWSGNHVSTYKGVKHIDGGFSDNLPIFDDNTIRICCFAGQTDISPFDRVKSELLSTSVLNMPLYFNFANCRRAGKALFPPPASFILSLLEQGFHDTKQFILTNDLILCKPCYSKGNLRDLPMFHQQLGPNATGGSGATQRHHLTISPCATPALSRAGSQRVRSAILGPIKLDENSGCHSGFLRPNDGFDRLLNDKLKRSCSPDSSLESSSSSSSPSEDVNNNNNNIAISPAPTVVVIGPEEGEQRERLDGNNNNDDAIIEQENIISSPVQKSNKPDANNMRPRKKSRPSETAIATGSGDNSQTNTTLITRRKSLANLNNNNNQQEALLVVQDRFRLAPNPLPSCPPSPNLNRHCTECIRMRQEARLDLVEEEIRLEAEKYHVSSPIKEGKFKSKLTSPLRWFRQQLNGTKHSYRFQQQTVAI